MYVIHVFLQVPLGILPYNENKCEEMIEIMSELQKYVPIISSDKQVHIDSMQMYVTVPQARIYPILFGGDQLTAVRARGAQKAKISSPDPKHRLEGIIPTAEGWHTKVVVLGVSVNNKPTHAVDEFFTLNVISGNMEVFFFIKIS